MVWLEAGEDETHPPTLEEGKRGDNLPTRDAGDDPHLPPLEAGERGDNLPALEEGEARSEPREGYTPLPVASPPPVRKILSLEQKSQGRL